MDSTDVERPASDEDLIQTCKETTGQDCSKIEWHTRKDLYFSTPDESLLAVVVDLDQTTSGSVRVFNGKEFIGMVGNTNKLVVIPWQSGWHYACFQAQHIGELR